jgi:hypothetical protein
MFMFAGTLVTSGTLPVVGAALPLGAVLGAALLVAVAILIGLADRDGHDGARRPAVRSRRATRSTWGPLGHGRSV